MTKDDRAVLACLVAIVFGGGCIVPTGVLLAFIWAVAAIVRWGMR